MTETTELSTDALNLLMPLHLVVNGTGHITHSAPTLSRIFAATPLIGKRLTEVFEVRRPAPVSTMDDLRNLAGQKLHLRMREDSDRSFKGLAVDLGDGFLINLSFGIRVAEAVRQHHLTGRDFAPTDLTVEMLYLVEAKTAVMEELKNLNERLQGAKTKAEVQAFTDTLTGLKNRRAMDHILTLYAARAERFGLMHIDLDYFKDVNDSLGHAAGDFVLQRVAGVLTAETRADDTVVRAGGDEFVIVFPGLTSRERLNNIAVRIIEKLQKPILFNGLECRISASIGTTVSENYQSVEPEQMLKDADAALYESKSAGRARVTFFSAGPDGGRAEDRTTSG